MNVYKCPTCRTQHNGAHFCGSAAVALPILVCSLCNETYSGLAGTHHICLSKDLPTPLGTPEALKYDNNKPDLSLIPREFSNELAKALMHGEKKYGRYNYRNGMDWHRLIAASLRHITAFNEGENTDPESGLSHLGHASACLAFLIVYQANGLGKDTRRK